MQLMTDINVQCINMLCIYVLPASIGWRKKTEATTIRGKFSGKTVTWIWIINKHLLFSVYVYCVIFLEMEGKWISTELCRLEQCFLHRWSGGHMHENQLAVLLKCEFLEVNTSLSWLINKAPSFSTCSETWFLTFP